MVLAGCSGGGDSASASDTTAPETTQPETTQQTTETTPATNTATDRETVRVTGGNLSVDGTEVFWRVQELIGIDVRPQPVETSWRTPPSPG